jgi:hypothetical protein
VNGAVTATRKDAYAHSKYVGSEEGSPKAKSEIGPQTCSENEETKSRDQEGRSRRGPTLHREIIPENDDERSRFSSECDCPEKDSWLESARGQLKISASYGPALVSE